jgi:plastocyanin
VPVLTLRKRLSPYPAMASPLSSRLLTIVAAAIAALALTAAPSLAAQLPGAHVSAKAYTQAASYPGLQHLHYEYGPIKITPGQNTIEFAPNDLKPKVPGYITRFSPNLIYTKSRKIPRVDVVHLHHGVWVMDGQPTFAAGEEKTIFSAPQGYGYHYKPSDGWIMNYMLHNLTPTPTTVSITYDIDFLPDSEPAAKPVVPVHPLWMDVSGIKAYPVFDARKGRGHKGKFTFPDDARGNAKQDIGPAHQWTARHDVTLVGTAGHLHPGGLWTDLDLTRGGTSKRLFRSVAKYFEPAGAVSWDVAMTATKPSWRVGIKTGDTLDVSATYDVRKASWYESMGIMVVFYANGIQPDAKDPFTQGVDPAGELTHGHLKENDNHGGSPYSGLPDPRSMLSGPPTRNVNISDFVYGRGDLGLTGRAGRPPTVRAGGTLKFTNLDALPTTGPRQSKYHTITACRAPCNRTTGIAYPTANGSVQFDSSELGYGPGYATPAANRNTWTTPKSLKPATYTYFCRIHPFMRGSFRVLPKKGSHR